MENRATCDVICDSETSYSRTLLSKFTSTWERRAQVRHYVLPNEIQYEKEKPDFLEELLPIRNCRSYLKLSNIQKRNILSYGWLAYNAKTIAIESKIISPVCYDIIDGHIPGVTDNESRKLIAETLADESYHILLSHYAMSVTEKNRKINRAIFPNFDLVSKVIYLENKYFENWQKTLVRLAVAVVSEIFISDYLKCLSSSSEIVKLNRETVWSHRMDEVAHGKIFTELTKLIYRELTVKQKVFFSSILHYPAQYFASKELAVWEKILYQVCPTAAGGIMQEASQEGQFDLSQVNYKNLVMLADEIDLKEFSKNFANLTDQEMLFLMESISD